jgi:HK97 family phage prohead protease
VSVTLQEAAERRAEATGSGGQARATAPDGVQTRRAAPMPAAMRAVEVTKDGKSFLRLSGMASVYEKRYEMWDWAGPYEEIVSEGAGEKSLTRNPDVVFLLNHTGIPFARTVSGTLDLAEPGGGLLSEAYLNPKRQDVQDLVASVEDGSSTEMSFAFRILDGRWSPDYTEYRINEYDIDRGDTSVVTFGANPHTSIEARAARFQLRADLLRALRTFDAPDLDLVREALSDAPAPPGRAVRIGERAARDLRHLRAQVADGSGLDTAARRALTGVLDDVLAGTGRLAGDGPLVTLLGLAEPAERPAARHVPTSLDFLERELAAARQLRDTA